METLEVCPETVVEIVRRRGAQSPGDSGHSRGRQINERALRSWRLSWTSYGAHQALERLWAATKGPALAFLFTPPGASTAIAVRFAGPILTASHDSAVATTAEVEVQEVR